MHRTGALVAVLVLCVSLAAAVPPCCGPTHTNCGHAPQPDKPCGAECPVVGSDGNCTYSCGQTCSSDADCGAWPWSPCSACHEGRCTGDAQFGNCTQVAPRQPGGRVAPILPQAWNSSFVMTNYTNYPGGGGGDTVKGFAWYDNSVGGLRQDFEQGACPFVELQPPLSNQGTCTVMFLRGYNYYIYLAPVGAAAPVPTAGASPGVCCKYHFPNWTPDSYRAANASFGGTTVINGQEADYWRFAYTCPWTRPEAPGPWPARLPAYTVQRDLWTVAGGNVPVRMNETLTSGYTDFDGLQAGPQDTATVFDAYVAKFDCMESGDAGFEAVCNRYNARGRLTYLGYS